MISVLITYHNEKELLAECLESFFRQKVPCIDEIIIFDDFSQFPAKDYIGIFNVKVIRSNVNVGPGAGRNILAKNAISEYIHFHDADDLVSDQWSTEVYKSLESGEVDLVITEVMSINLETGQLISNAVMKVNDLMTGKDAIQFAIDGSILLPSTTLRKSFFLKVDGYRSWEYLKQSEDFDFHLRLMLLAPRISVVLKPLVIQRIRSGSHSINSIDECYLSALQVISEQRNSIEYVYRINLARKASRIASYFYQKGNHVYGDRAYNLSRNIGEVYRDDRNKYFNLVMKYSSLRIAEAVAMFYRSIKFWKTD